MSVNGTVVAFIFARGGSKGVPGKNLRPLAGKPLIAHAITQAKAAAGIDRVVVSTDDEEIARVARQWGAEVPFMRPAELATDEAPEWLAWRHALQETEDVGTFVCVPATAPLRQPGDIEACLGRLGIGDVDVVFVVTAAAHNPYFNMVTLDGDGLAHLAMQAQDQHHQRQSAPAMFDITTVCYATHPQFIARAEGLFDGRVGVVEVPPERALDIDTEFDFRVAEALLAQQQ